MALYNCHKIRNTLVLWNVLLISCVTDASIMLALAPKLCNTLNNCLDLQNIMVPSTMLLALSTGIRSGTLRHVIPLNNHQHNECNVSLMTPSAACDRKLVTSMHNMPSNAIYKPHMPRSTYTRQLCQYIHPI